MQLFSEVNPALLELIWLWCVTVDVALTPSLVWICSKRYRYFWRPVDADSKTKRKESVISERNASNNSRRFFFNVQTVAPKTPPEVRRTMNVRNSSISLGSEDNILQNIGCYKSCNSETLATTDVQTEECQITDIKRNDNIIHINHSDFDKICSQISIESADHVINSFDSGGDINIQDPEPILSAAKLLQYSSYYETCRIKTINDANVVQESKIEKLKRIEEVDLSEDVYVGESDDNVSPNKKQLIERIQTRQLPSIFMLDINERHKHKFNECNVQTYKQKKNGSNTSLYYLSGEYHPDNLTGSLFGSLSKTDDLMITSLDEYLQHTDSLATETPDMTQSAVSDTAYSANNKLCLTQTTSVMNEPLTIYDTNV